MSSLCGLKRVFFGSLGSFDSSVHISEEASNAAVAVPWAIVYAIGIAGVLGWGQYALYARVCFSLIDVHAPCSSNQRRTGILHGHRY